MLYGIGTDIVEVARIESILKKHDSRFLDKVFSKTEIQYCKKNILQHSTIVPALRQKRLF